MDPISIIVAALIAGVSAGATDAAGEAIKDAYQGLKGLIVGKFAHRPDVEVAIASQESNPQSSIDNLKRILADAGVGEDKEIVDKAQQVRSLVDQRYGQNAFNANFYNKVQGVVQGSGNQVTMTFHDKDES